MVVVMGMGMGMKWMMMVVVNEMSVFQSVCVAPSAFDDSLKETKKEEDRSN